MDFGLGTIPFLRFPAHVGAVEGEAPAQDALAALLGDAPGAVKLVSNLEEAEEYLRARTDAFGAIVTAGARDPGLPVLARRLAGKER